MIETRESGRVLSGANLRERLSVEQHDVVDEEAALLLGGRARCERRHVVDNHLTV